MAYAVWASSVWFVILLERVGKLIARLLIMFILESPSYLSGSHGEQGSHYGGGQYGSGYMQRNPSYGQGGNYGNQHYSNYENTDTYGYGTTGSGDTRYGTSAGGDTHYGMSAGGDTRYGTGGGGYYDSRSRYYGTSKSSASGGKYKSPDGQPTIDFQYHPQYPGSFASVFEKCMYKLLHMYRIVPCKCPWALATHARKSGHVCMVTWRSPFSDSLGWEFPYQLYSKVFTAAVATQETLK